MKWLDLFPSFFDGVKEYFSRKHELRMKKLDLKYKVKEAEVMAEINYQQRKLEGEINWELESIRNSGWKDEALTIFTMIIITFCFVPPLQPYTLDGFGILGQTPMWFQVMIGVVYSSAFGVRAFGKYQQLVTLKHRAIGSDKHQGTL